MVFNRPADVALIQRACWIILARPANETDLQELPGHYDARGLTGVLERLLSSPEFHLLYRGWRDDLGIGKDPVAHEAGLRGLGRDDEFVRWAYEYVLGRPADEDGLRHYVRDLAAGEFRRHVVRTLVLSDEFASRYERYASHEGGFVPRDVQLCELANPAKWDNPDWIRMLRSLKVLPDHKLQMHRKSYEFTQLLFGLQRLSRLSETASVLSVGAGHECVLYWLANHTGRVVATDTYEGKWQSKGAREGSDQVITRPEAFAPFPYRSDRLTFLRMDGRRLTFGDSEFDIVYSLSSIEHFGGLEGATRAVAEMARVLKPGGVLALATEYILSGPPYEEAFQADDIRTLVSHPDLRLVEPIDEAVYRRYHAVPVDLRRNMNQRPHMVVQVDDTVFTSVMVFLEKARDLRR